MRNSLNLEPRYHPKVTKVQQYSPGIAIISFEKLFDFEVGQYITIFFPGTSTPEGKAYSLASTPEDDEMMVAVKNIGEYSDKLCNLKVGDKLEISAAYGFFDPKVESGLICLAGGVGISPIFSIIKHSLAKDPNRDIKFLHSCKTVQERAFNQDLKKLAKKCKNFGVTYYITQEEVDKKTNYKQGRINPTEIAKLAKDETFFLICGSVEFVGAMWHGLVKAGIDDQQISSETFFEA